MAVRGVTSSTALVPIFLIFVCFSDDRQDCLDCHTEKFVYFLLTDADVHEVPEEFGAWNRDIVAFSEAQIPEDLGWLRAHL